MFEWQEAMGRYLRFEDSRVPSSRFKRWEFYRLGLILNLTKMLQRKFSETACLLGEEQFPNICHEFIMQSPSQYFSIDHYGEKLPAYLEKILGEHYPYLGEFAALEWALEAFNPSNNRPNQPNQEKLELTHPLQGQGFTLFSSRFPLQAIWHGEFSELSETLEVSAAASQLLFFILYRSDDSTIFEPIKTWQWAILTKLSADRPCPLEELMSEVMIPEDEWHEVQEFFSFLTQNHLIASCSEFFKIYVA